MPSLLKLLTGLSSRLRKITGLSSKLLKLLIEFSSYLLKMYWITSKTFIKNCNHYYVFKPHLINYRMGGSVNFYSVNNHMVIYSIVHYSKLSAFLL